MVTSARRDRQQVEEQTAPPEPSEASLVPALPDDWEFKIEENVEIPTSAPRNRPTTHPWLTIYDNIGHNSSFFVPLSYWITKRGRTVEKTPFSWQKQTIATTFADWKKKSPDARKKWRLVTVAREVGQDPSHPNMSGVRCWTVDTSRDTK